MAISNRGAEIANPRQTLLMRARRDVRDAIANLGLPVPDHDPDEDPDADLPSSEMGAPLPGVGRAPQGVTWHKCDVGHATTRTARSPS